MTTPKERIAKLEKDLEKKEALKRAREIILKWKEKILSDNLKNCKEE